MGVFKEDIDSDVVVEEKVTTTNNTDNKKGVLLINDDYNSFENVIKALVDICNMSNEQAENAAMEVHTKGKAIVAKDKPTEQLNMIKIKLQLRGLNAELT